MKRSSKYRLATFVLLAGTALALAGCGNKGPLVHPQPDTPAPASTTPAEP